MIQELINDINNFSEDIMTDENRHTTKPASILHNSDCIALIIVKVYNTAFKGGRFTCNKYILNTYLYILISFNHNESSEYNNGKSKCTS